MAPARLRDAAYLLVVALLYAALAYAGIATTRDAGRIALLWVPNGLVAAWLLRGGARLTLPVLLLCGIANYLVDLAMGDGQLVAAGLAMANQLEILVVAALIRRFCGDRPDMSDPRSHVWLGPVIVLGSAASASLAQLSFWLALGAAAPMIWRTWLLADVLSMVVVLPIALIAIDQWRARRWPSVIEWRQWLAMAGLAIAGTWLIFAQGDAPWMFLEGPIILYAAFRTGLWGTAVAMAIVTVIASIATMHGVGPIAAVRGGLTAQVLTFQLFLIANFAMGIPVAALLAARARDRAALIASGAAMQEILDNVRDVIFRTDPRGCWSSLNPAWRTLTGYPPEASIGWPVSALVHPDELAEVRALHPQLVSGALQTCNRVQRIRHADGGWRHIELRFRRLARPEGSFAGTIGSIRDITEQVRQASALALSEARFRRIAEAAPVGIFRTDITGRPVYANAAWRALAGITEATPPEQTWLERMHPDDRERVAAIWADALAEQAERRVIFRWRHADGALVWVDTIARPEQDADGASIGFIGVSFDVTEQHNALRALAERDAQLTHITDNVTDAVLRLDLAGLCLYVSPSAHSVFRVAPETLLGVNLLTGFHAEDAPRLHAEFARLARGERERLLIAYRARLPGNPAYSWFEAHCGLVRDARGAPAEVVASVRDVSANKALEAELLEARARAEVAARAKTVFLANMSHEIRTPMNGVIGFTDLLQRTALDPIQRDYVRLIADSGRAMMQLLSDVLDLSRVDSGQLRVVSEPVDLHAKLASVTQLMAPLAREKQLRLTTRIGADVPAWVMGDPLRLRQVLLNLMGNAIKFTESGGVELSLELAAPGQLRFGVRDTGIGIDPDQCEAIFQPFAQADESIARRFGGSGLGLSISAELVRLMDGAITVESTPGAGSLFSVTLPLVPATAPRARPTAPPPIPPPGRAIALLIVEDHDINRQLVQAMARAGGIEPDFAVDGAEALARVAAADEGGRPYDLIFMDVQLPGMDGLATTRALRAQGVRTPVIALTAYADPADIAATRAAGMDDHLAKPIQLAPFFTMIARYATGAPAVPRAEALTPSSALRARYVARKTALADALAALPEPPGEAALAAVADDLHKLAGTAALFGDTRLGAAAAAIEQRLRHADAPEPRREALAAARAALADA